MNAVISAQAGLCAISRGSGFEVIRLSDGGRTISSKADLFVMLRWSTDVVERNFPTEQAALDEARRQSDVDMAIRLMNMLLEADPEVVSESFVVALEGLLSARNTEQQLRRVFFSAPLPRYPNFEIIEPLLRNAQKTRNFVNVLLGVQSTIVDVINSLESIEGAKFNGGEYTKEEFALLARQRGAISSLVAAIEQGHNISAGVADAYIKLRDVANIREVMPLWTQKYERTPRQRRSYGELIREQSEFGISYAADPQANRRAFESAMNQQITIVKLLRDGDFDRARRYVNDLVKQQQRRSEPEHIAKSLTRLSQAARQLELFDLHLEWAARAVEVKGDDPFARGQFADALIIDKRYTDAEYQLSQAEVFGDDGYAANGRARIFRERGAFADALAEYKRVLERVAGTRHAEYSYLGLGEVYRALEKYSDAITALRLGIESFPESVVLHTELGSVLTDIAEFAEATKIFERARELQADEPYAWSGLARVEALQGNFDKAKSIYESTIRRFPFNSNARRGLVGALIEIGKRSEALYLAREGERLLRSSENRFVMLGDALRANMLLQEAVKVYQDGVNEFPDSAVLRIKLAMSLLTQTDYAQALHVMESARLAFPNDLRIALTLASVWRRVGHLAQAASIYQQVLKDRPGNRAALNGLAALNIAVRQYDLANWQLQRVATLTQDDWRGLILQALVSDGLRQRSQALALLRRVSAKCPFRVVARAAAAALVRMQARTSQHIADYVLERSETASLPLRIPTLHALMRVGRTDEAFQVNEAVQASALPEPYKALSSAIFASYQMVERGDAANDNELYHEELALIALEAA